MKSRVTCGRLGPAIAVFLIAVFVTTAFSLPSEDEKHKKEKIFDEAFSLESGGELHIDVDDMDIHVKTGVNGESSVQVFVAGRDRDKAREYFEELRFDARLEDNKLVVESREPYSRNGGFWNRYGNVRAWAIVTVPTKIDARIETEDGDIRVDNLSGKAQVSTEDGDVDISDVRGPSVEIRTEDGDVTAGFLEADKITMTGEDGDLQIDRIEGKQIRISLSDGDIEVSQIEGDDITIRTKDGDVVVSRIDGGETSVESSDGDIEIAASGSKLRAECSDGDIKVALSGEMEVDLSADDGDIELSIPKNTGAELDLRGGHVSVRSKIAIKGKVSKESIRGMINDGGPLIRVRTSDGSIVVREG